jgi:hypothetical protein
VVVQMTEYRNVSQVPWQVTHDEFVRTARSIRGGGAVCVFVIDDTIPQSARSGYAALVIAYARADEPVYILDDGAAALLIREGGVSSGAVAGRRVLEQMRRLALQDTLRAGVAPLTGDADGAIAAARDVAAVNAPGAVHTTT